MEETKMGDYDDGTQKALWNFDGAELFLIFGIKQKIVEAFESWELETAYRQLRLLRGELDAKLKRDVSKSVLELEQQQGKKERKTEKKECDDIMKIVDEKYNSFKLISDASDEDKSGFYQVLEEFYLYLSFLMKKHGLYFREGEDMTLAVLRR